MTKRHIGIPVVITRCVDDQQYSPFVECEFVDAHGKRWTIHEKEAVISIRYLDSKSSYPQPGVIACEIVSTRFSEDGQEIASVDTEWPWHVQAVDETKCFEVLKSSLVEWEER